MRQGLTAVALALGIALVWPRAVDEPARPPIGIVESQSDYLPTVRVRAYEYGFEPTNLVVKVGYPVSWRAVGESQHLVTPSDRGARWVFYRAARRGAARHIFREPGVYAYYCSLHPRMRGTVTVRRNVARARTG